MKIIRENLVGLALTLYLFGAVVTFGHAAANHETIEECEARVFPNGIDPERYNGCRAFNPAVEASWSGIVSAAIWPFYWSWEIQS